MAKKLGIIAGGLMVVLLALGAWLYQPDLSRDYLKQKYAGPDSHFLQVEGMMVHYRDQGQGPPLVLLHGLAASLHTWQGWAEALSKDFRVIRLDLPGFGLTGPSPERDYSVEAYVSFLARFLDKLGIDRTNLAGNSLGGLIAWNFAWKYPERIKRLILVDPAGMPRKGDRPLAMRLASNPLLKALLRNADPRLLIRRSLKAVYFDDDKITPGLEERYRELILAPGNRQAFGDLVGGGALPEPVGLIKIKCPTLIMWGQHDAWIPVSDAEVFKALIPNSRVIIYPDAGHVPMEELPGQTARDALSFLSE